MNQKAISVIRKQNNSFSKFTFIMLAIGTGFTAGAAATFVFGIVPVIQGIDSFDAALLIAFLIFGIIGIGLLCAVIFQIKKYIKCGYLLKSGKDGKGTFIAREEILVNNQPYYRIKYSFNNENNDQHYAKTRYIYSEHEIQELEQMGTFPIKFQGKYSIVTWIGGQSTDDDIIETVDVDCRIIRFKRVVMILNIIFGVLMFAVAIGTIMLRNGELSSGDTIGTVLIVIFVIAILGVFLTNIAAFFVRKILLAKSVVQGVRNFRNK